MNNTLNFLTLNDFFYYTVAGLILAILHLFLLWQTTNLVKKVRQKNFVSFLSSVLRNFLLIFISIALSKQNIAYFLIIMCSFLLVRACLLNLFHPSFKKKLTKTELVYADKKKMPLETTRNKRRKRITETKRRKTKRRY